MPTTMRYDPYLPPPGAALARPVAPAFTGMALLETSAPATYPRHRHRDYEVIVPLRGAYRCRVDGHALALARGQVLVVKPGDWHEDLLPAGERHIGIWFALGALPLFRPGIAAEAQVAALPPRQVAALVARLLAEQGLGDGFSLRLQEAACLELFWLLVRALPAGALAPGFLAANQDQVLRRQLEELFEAHHRGGLAVAAMAEALHSSPRALTAACRRLTGLSPAKAFAAHRLRRAHEMLAQTGLSVKGVAAHLGYADQHHFSRAYKAAFKVPPSSRR
jgi:AraC-like DNA-binding protein